ncbi:MAG: hypothetical protein Q4E57_05550 [Eubacteriales bacterium]|nr:hypothetical protein [Eubacteriales bacterium]
MTEFIASMMDISTLGYAALALLIAAFLVIGFARISSTTDPSEEHELIEMTKYRQNLILKRSVFKKTEKKK